MKIGDLVTYGASTIMGSGVLGVLLRKLQWDEYEDGDYLNWDGNPAWWALFIDQTKPCWAYEHELTLVKKGN